MTLIDVKFSFHDPVYSYIHLPKFHSNLHDTINRLDLVGVVYDMTEYVRFEKRWASHGLLE